MGSHMKVLTKLWLLLDLPTNRRGPTSWTSLTEGQECRLSSHSESVKWPAAVDIVSTKCEDSTAPLVISDRVKSWTPSTYWTKSTLFLLNLKLLSSSWAKPFPYPVFVHSICVKLISWHYLTLIICHLKYISLYVTQHGKKRVLLWMLLCWKAYISIAMKPVEWRDRNVERCSCCSDTMQMNECRYDLEKREVHSGPC